MAYNPNEARDSNGRWASGRVKAAVSKGKAAIRQHVKSKVAAINAIGNVGAALYTGAAIAGAGMAIHRSIRLSPNTATKRPKVNVNSDAAKTRHADLAKR